MSKYKKSFSSQEAQDLFKDVMNDIYSTKREYRTIKELFLNKNEFLSLRYFSPILIEADLAQQSSKTLIYSKIIENQLYVINFAPETNIIIPTFFSKEILENKIGVFKLEEEIFNVQSEATIEKIIDDKLMTVAVPIQIQAFLISNQNKFNSIDEYKSQYISNKALNQKVIPDILEKNIYKIALNKNLNAYSIEENELVDLENHFFNKWLKSEKNKNQSSFVFKNSNIILNYSILKLINRLKKQETYKLSI